MTSCRGKTSWCSAGPADEAAIGTPLRGNDSPSASTCRAGVAFDQHEHQDRHGRAHRENHRRPDTQKLRQLHFAHRADRQDVGLNPVEAQRIESAADEGMQAASARMPATSVLVAMTTIAALVSEPPTSYTRRSPA
jgi:hypothetical protein